MIAESAPEIEEVRVEGMTEPEPADSGFIPLDSLRHRPPEHAMACTVPAELDRPGAAGEEPGKERA
ncbi:hypothetical protein [Allosalinactinospora lopnorensis]|uniref:hypothetical protein n=1 Tax=Allosalinactinospora lopnorensis TaxID=1352348 RepID=UPI000698F404|nr:hypothetical protein [Allosalinactinospora lopnorensis]